MSDERTEAIEADVEATDDEVTRLADAIEAERGTVSAADVLGG